MIPLKSRLQRAAAALGNCPTVALLASAGLIEIALGSLLGLGRPASHVPTFLVYYWCAAVGYLVACWAVSKDPGTFVRARALAWIWVAAIAFRLTALPLMPSLSEDATRYRWQGMVQDAGGDPYVSVPADPRWEGLRDSTWHRVSSKDKPSAYGPLVEQLNLWHYRLIALSGTSPQAQVWLFKLPFALAELLLGIALMGLLRAASKPRRWILIYLWCPLPVVEFWAEGHNDAVAVALVVCALTFHLRRRPTCALALLAVATMCKFWPIILFPFLAMRRGSSGWTVHWRGLVAAAAVGATLCLPYWRSLPAVLGVLDGFAAGWRNNDSLFGILLLLAGGDARLAATVGRAIVICLVAGLVAIRPRGCKGEFAAICVLLFLSANCFPWYLSWMLPLAALYPSAPLLLWTALAPLAYHVVPAYEAVGLWEYDDVLLFLEYFPVLGWLAVSGGDAAHRLVPRRPP